MSLAGLTAINGHNKHKYFACLCSGARLVQKHHYQPEKNKNIGKKIRNCPYYDRGQNFVCQPKLIFINMIHPKPPVGQRMAQTEYLLVVKGSSYIQCVMSTNQGPPREGVYITHIPQLDEEHYALWHTDKNCGQQYVNILYMRVSGEIYIHPQHNNNFFFQ